MGSAPLERMLIFHFIPAQKPATREVMGSRSEMAVIVLLNLHAMAIINLHNVYIHAQRLTVLSTSEKQPFALGGGIAVKVMRH